MNFSKLFFLIGLVFFAASCHIFGGNEPIDEPELTDDLRKELSAIEQNYNPPACYFARFDIKSTTPGKSADQAVGTIRADNLKNRMVMEFFVPYIRIKLSRIVISDQKVFINDLYNHNKTELPLEQFAVGGMARNSIRLPFHRFQDILYARLPIQVLKGRDVQRTLQGNKIDIAWQSKFEKYRYSFEARRLRQIIYNLRYQQNEQDVTVSLQGSYGRTIFPGRILMQAARPGGKPELLDLRFTYINSKVQCVDSHFVRR